MRLSSRFCLFCFAKQAKPSPARRLSTLRGDFVCFRAANLIIFNGAAELKFGCLNSTNGEFLLCSCANHELEAAAVGRGKSKYGAVTV